MRDTLLDARDEYLALLADGLPVPEDVSRGAAAYYRELCDRERGQIPESGMPWELAVREHGRLLRDGKPVPQWVRDGVRQYHLLRRPRIPGDAPEELRDAERAYRWMVAKGLRPPDELREAWIMCRRIG